MVHGTLEKFYWYSTHNEKKIILATVITEVTIVHRIENIFCKNKINYQISKEHKIQFF